MITAQNAVVLKIETTNGTYDAPLSADHDIRLLGGGKATVTYGNEPIGKPADGTMNDGPIAGKFQKVEYPELMAEILAPVDETTEPKWYKLAKIGGYNAKTFNTTYKGLELASLPSCTTASAIFQSSGCGKGETIKARGMKGKSVIYFDGANAVMMIKLVSMVGALQEAVSYGSVSPFTLTGNNTTAQQRAGMYIITIQGQVYQIIKLEIDSGLTIATRPKNDVSGIDYAQATAGEKRLNMTLKKLDGSEVADNNIHELAVANSKGDVTILGQALVGGAYDITVTGTQLLDPSTGDADGFETFEISTTFETCTIVPLLIA